MLKPITCYLLFCYFGVYLYFLDMLEFLKGTMAASPQKYVLQETSSFDASLNMTPPSFWRLNTPNTSYKYSQKIPLNKKILLVVCGLPTRNM